LSLEPLGVNEIDLNYLRRRDPATPINDTIGAMADLVKAGKIKGIVLSKVSANTLKKGKCGAPHYRFSN